MKLLYLLFSTLSYISAGPGPIKVAVIDSGFDFKSTWSNHPNYGQYVPKLCSSGHVPLDIARLSLNGIVNVKKPAEMKLHGTHIAGLIAKNAADANYCLIIYDYFIQGAEENNLSRSNRMIRKAINDGVSVINYSGGGYQRDTEECKLVSEALDKGIRFVAAAGNNKKNLDSVPFFPAMCDKRIIVVENSSPGSKTNYSKKIKTLKIEGDGVISLFPNNSIGRMSGTSQSTAIATGILVKIMDEERKLEKFTKKTSK